MIKKHKLIGFAAVAAFFLLLSCKNNLSPEIPVEDIIISSNDEGEISGGISIVKDMTKSITVKIIPENATNKTLAYSSTPGEVAAIDRSGSIRAGKVGNAVIKITAANGVQKTINVRVTPKPIPVTNIVFEESAPESLIIGENYRIMAKAQPNDATNKGLTYTADNDKAYVASDGTVTAQSEGTVTITVKSQSNPAITETVTFTVKKKPQIKYESKQAVMVESAAGKYTFELQTIDGKLDYEPSFTSNTLPWVSGAPTISSRTDPAKDVISFTCLKNKTVWDRRAYIKFKDKKTGQYIKGADGKDLEAKILQKRNENPVVHYKWVDGIGSPAENEKEKVGINNNGIPTGDTYPQSYVFKWKETANTKFYNVRKLDKLYAQGQFPNDYFVINGIYGEERQGKDISQCWAKTASNMLHWWFEQNKDYIDQYKQKAAIEAWKLPLYNYKYERGLSDVEENKKSDIANIFRAYTHNNPRGGYIEDGLTWYLYKRDAQKTLSPLIYPGLFNDVFTHDTSPITIERCETKAEFEQLMNKALDNKRAIGIFWQGSKGNKPYQHAVTCWGAAYDEDNNIICLYIAESNLTEAVLYPFGVRYQGNIYEEAEKNRTYMFNYALGKPENIYIDGLTTLDLGEAQWKEWFDAHP